MQKYDLYQYAEYKQALKQRVLFLKQSKSQWTLKKLAEKIPVQYTFLSKVLNTKDTHLNEDHLFRAATALNFLPDEIDYLLLLRSSSVTGEFSRKEFLTKKIDHIKKQRNISADYSVMSSVNLQQEMRYLLNPLALITHVALSLPEIQKSPPRLGSLLGISQAKLTEILEILEANEFIEINKRKLEILKIKPARTHFSREHPLMRVQQSSLKNLLHTRMSQTPEDSKESFFVTFSMDEEGFSKVQELFKNFIKEVQSIKSQSKNTNLFQLSFDLLKWF